MRRPALILVVSMLLIGTLIAIYFAKSTTTKNIIADDESVANDEDYFADNVQLVKYTKDGALYYEMQGVRITHNDTSDIALVTYPVMTLYADKNVRWHVTANDGKLYNHQQAVDLTNEVVISKFEHNKEVPALLLTTNSMTLHPESNTLTTRDAVTIKTDSTRTTATGMKANLDTNHIDLLNNVRSYYGGK